MHMHICKFVPVKTINNIIRHHTVKQNLHNTFLHPFHILLLHYLAKYCWIKTWLQMLLSTFMSVTFCMKLWEHNLDPQKQAVLCDLSSFGHISIINAVDVSSSAGLCVNMVKRKFFKALPFIYHFKYGKFLKSAFYL